MFRKLLTIVAVVAIVVFSAGTLAPIIGAALGSAVAGAAVAGAIGGALSSIVTGGDWRRGALIGAVGGGIAEGLSGATEAAMAAKAGETAVEASQTGAALSEAAPSATQADPGMLGAGATPPPAVAPAPEAVGGPASTGPTLGGPAEMADLAGTPTGGMLGGAAPQSVTVQAPQTTGMLGNIERWATEHPWLAKTGGKLIESGLGGLANVAQQTPGEQQMELEEWRRRNLSGSISGMQATINPQRPSGPIQRVGGAPVFKGGMLRG